MDKQPGVRSIGIGEVLRQIIGKVLMKLLKANGSLQLCTGQDAGGEPAIHVVYEIFNKDLYIQGGWPVKSEEGVTQGDLTAMTIYAFGIKPLFAWLSKKVNKR